MEVNATHASGDGSLESVVTVSIDDGHPSDLRAADLLAKLGYAATFYVPARNPERATLSLSGVRQLAESFEVGAHTFNHAELPRLDSEAARREIVDGKVWLEDSVSRPVRSFCYPRGKFNRSTMDLVVEAGFTGARTTMGNIVKAPANVFLSGATSQAFSHGRVVQARHAILERNWVGVVNYARVFRFATDWVDHFERGVSHVCAQGGVAHLWFHSWELDDLNEWERLEDFLRGLKNRYSFTCETNGQVFTRYSAA